VTWSLETSLKSRSAGQSGSTDRSCTHTNA
jgi:hypothetical protein